MADYLPEDWRERCVSWAERTDAVRELRLFSSRAPMGGARAGRLRSLEMAIIVHAERLRLKRISVLT
jgi:hypothetical protein